MAFLPDTLLPGSHIRRSDTGKHGKKVLRKSQSHAGFLRPIVRLVRDPIGTIGSAVGNFSEGTVETAASQAELDRKQVLYLRMQNVGFSAFTIPVLYQV